MDDNNEIEAEYCAMHALMVLESMANQKDITNDAIAIKKEDYETIISLVERHQKRYQKHRQINLIKSIAGVIGLFLMMLFIVKADPKLAAATSMGLLVWTVYQNGKKGKENYKNWQTNIIEKNVSEELLKYNQQYLKEV